jgi:hypothetical protein
MAYRRKRGMGQFDPSLAAIDPNDMGAGASDLGTSVTTTVSNLAPSPGTAPFQWGALLMGLAALFAVVVLVKK